MLNLARARAALMLTMTMLSTAAGADTVRVGGTGAVTALLKAVAPMFEQFSPGDRLEIVVGMGSSGGIVAVQRGAIDIAMSGRPVSAKEGIGLNDRPLLETPFVFASGVNLLPNLSRADILKIFSGQMLNYADGSPIRLILRSRNDAYTTLLINSIDGMKDAMAKARARTELPVAGTDQDNMDEARSLPGSLAGFPLTQLLTETNALYHVRYEGVEPTLKAMQSGTYPLKLRIDAVTRVDQTAVVERFFSFMMSDQAAARIEEMGARVIRKP